MEKMIFENFRFNYRNIQGQPVILKMTQDELQSFETLYKFKVTKKYRDKLIAPYAEVIVSNDCKKIEYVVLLADAILN